MRLDALLSDVMTAGWPATLATVTAFPRCLPPVHCGGGGAGNASTGVFYGRCLRRPKGFLHTWMLSSAILAETCLCLSVCLHPGLWSWWWSSNGQQVVVHLDPSNEENAFGKRTPPPSCPLPFGLVYLVCPCQCLPHPVASHRRKDEPATSGMESRKTLAGCPRLLEQRPNRGVLRAAASRRAGPHPPQILKGRGDGFLFGGPGDSETWCGDEPGRGRFASENAAAHTSRLGGRYRQR